MQVIRRLGFLHAARGCTLVLPERPPGAWRGAGSQCDYRFLLREATRGEHTSDRASAPIGGYRLPTVAAAQTQYVIREQCLLPLQAIRRGPGCWGNAEVAEVFLPRTLWRGECTKIA
jgi:hypothetical protein